MLRVLALVSILLSLIGCSGGGGSAAPAQQPQAAETGGVTLSLTDAEGDFLSYGVDVVAVTLQRRNGDIVQLLPRTTRADFAQLTQVAEFVGARDIPVGTYDRITMTLDYANSDIQAQDANGVGVVLTPVDADGASLARLDVQLNLDDSSAVVVTRAATRAIVLDFDLAASNTIDFANGKVQVSPFLVADPTLDATREHRVRGLLDSVNQAGSSFAMKVRPFHVRDGEFGALSVRIDGGTQFEIDGVASVGADGLAALSQLARGAAVVATGMLQENGGARSLMASRVLAGSSVPGFDHDAVVGVVVGRQGDALRVRGRRFVAPEDGGLGEQESRFATNIGVTVGVDTHVSAERDLMQDRTADDISVGQWIVALGDLDAAGDLDASPGRVRLVTTEAVGDVVAVDQANHRLVLQLRALAAMSPAAFDFAGTGTSGNDADPSAYEVDLGALDLSGLSTDDLVRVRGVVNSFGEAPPDFVGTTLIDVNREERVAELSARWGATGSSEPFTELSADKMVLSAEARQVLRARGVLFDHRQVSAIVAPAAGNGRYALVVRGTASLRFFSTFGALTRELSTQLGNGRRVLGLNAAGQFNVTNDQLSAYRMVVVISR